MTRPNLSQYIPLEHEKFTLVTTLLKIARDQDRSKAEGELTSVLIYVNAIDYVAKHLLSNLQIITHIITYRETNARVFYETPTKEITDPLGTIIRMLDKYDFPDKNNFLSKLSSFNKLRVKYIHKFMNLDEDDIKDNKIDKDISQLCEDAEDIIESYDQIRIGIIKTWEDYKKSCTSTENVPRIQQTSESQNTIYPPKQSN